MLKRPFILLLKKLDLGSAIAMRLVKLTGKDTHATHPKHLIPQKLWFAKYLKKSDTVLDIGCNNGAITLKIANKVKKVVGIDIDGKLIQIAKEKVKNQNASFKIFDANNKLPFPSNSLDKVLCSDVLEHLKKRDFALNEIKRVLKPKGLLFLVCDNPDTSWKKLQKSVGIFYYADRDHKYEYPEEEIISKLKSKKFKIISVHPVTYDTPFKGLIDITGGISLTLYKNLRLWRQNMVKKHPGETTGYTIIAKRADAA